MLAALNSPRFVDQAPIQVYATLLDEGRYLCSISTMYRLLGANLQVKERRRTARHPPRTVPELLATGPGQVYSWDIKCRRRHLMSYADLRTMPTVPVMR